MEKRDRLLLIAVCILAAGIRLYRLGFQSLWIDEILTLTVSNPKPGLTIWDYLQHNIHGPFHSFIVYLVHLFSMSEFWLRFPSAVAGVVTVIVVYRWISFWIGRRTALVTATLLTINPMHLYYSQELRNYSFALMFGSLACYFFHRLLERESKRTVAWFCVTTALAALSNFTAAFLFLTHTLIYFFRRGLGWSGVKRWLLVCVIILILISPWIYRIYVIIDVSKLVTPVMPGELSTTERLRGSTTVKLDAVPYAFYVFSAGFTLGPSLRSLHQQITLGEVVRTYIVWIALVAVSFGALAIFGVYTLVRRRGRWRELLLYLLVPLICTLLLCWQNAKAFNARYLILALPAYLCIIGSGLLALRSSLVKSSFYLLVVFLSTVSIGNYFFKAEYAKENVRDAIEYIEANGSPEECVFAPTVREVAEYYLRSQRAVRAVRAPAGTSKETVERRLDRRLAGCDSIWYLRARPWVDDADNHVIDYLKSRYRLEQVEEFEGCGVFHGTPRFGR